MNDAAGSSDTAGPSDTSGLVHVVGLGPAGADLVTAGTIELIEAHPRRFLRTDWHPAARVVADAVTFDDIYERADSFAEVYREIVERLVRAAHDAAAAGEAVLYAVPGSPTVAEHTVELLLADDRVQVVIHPALSFLDLTWVRLGVDPVELGVRLVDGHRFDTESAGERGPLLVAQCSDRFVLSDIKLSVDEPGDATVTILQRLGSSDEVIVTVPWDEMDRTVEADHLTSLWIPRMPTGLRASTVALESLMSELRSSDAWKRSQTHDSLKRYLIEESYEVLEAIDGYDAVTGDGAEALRDELGDLLYQVVFHSALGSEAGWFDLGEVVTAIHDKLVRRHPHVTEGSEATDDTGGPTVEELVRSWEQDKRDEHERDSIYDGIPSAMPALARALKVARKAASQHSGDARQAYGGDESALGNQLLEIVDAAAAAGLDPEDALRRAVDRRLDRLRSEERRGSGA